MKASNALWAALALSAAGLGAVLGFVRTGTAQADAELTTCRADYAMVGIATGERGRVHVTWAHPDGTASDPLNIRVQFFDGTGALLKEDVLTLAPNTDVASEILAPKRKDAATREDRRLEFRAVVTVEPPNGDPGFPADTGCPDVITSLELVNGIRTFLVVAPTCPVGRHCPSKCPVPSPTPPPAIDAVTDGVTPDLAFPPDLGFSPDVGFSPDLAFHPDLAFAPDLASFPSDLSGPPSN